MSIDESVYGPDDPEVAGDLTNLGMLLKEAGKTAAADPLLRRALSIYEREFGAGSQQAMKVREILAGSNPLLMLGHSLLVGP